MKDELKWRLREQPTAENLRELVKDELLTKDEAREILFSKESKEDKDVKSLEEQVKFLQELVVELMRSQRVTQIHYPKRYEWITTTPFWSNTFPTSGTVGNAVTYTASANNTFSIN